MTKQKLIRDVLGSPIPQHFSEESGIFIANTNGTGDATGVDFTKLKLIRDALGSVIPQYYDVVEEKFKPVTSENTGGGGASGVPIGAIVYENINQPHTEIGVTRKIVLEDAANV